jgi:hypothetical protein
MKVQEGKVFNAPETDNYNTDNNLSTVNCFQTTKIYVNNNTRLIETQKLITNSSQ